MRNTIARIIKGGLVFSVALMVASIGFSQDAMNHQRSEMSNQNNQKSGVTVSISGTVMVKSSLEESQYFLDENNDGEADYQLQIPTDQSNFTAPKDGEKVMIRGTMNGSSDNGTPQIAVSELTMAQSNKNQGGNTY